MVAIEVLMSSNECFDLKPSLNYPQRHTVEENESTPSDETDPISPQKSAKVLDQKRFTTFCHCACLQDKKLDRQYEENSKSLIYPSVSAFSLSTHHYPRDENR